MESINLCTFCARAVVRIDQFVVFGCWLVLFVCTWLLFSSVYHITLMCDVSLASTLIQKGVWNVLYENGSCGFHFIT